jgi:16S rRNA (cytosine1402-N4)-methyltransferase
MYHIPVMSYEISQFLINKPYGIYVDCTFGGGGHSFYLLNKFKNIKIIAFDWDEDAYNNFFFEKKNDKKRIIFIRDNFKNIEKSLAALKINKVNGIFADVGVSSKQFNDLSRGFSFNSNTLDMRMDQRVKINAMDVVNSYSSKDLANIFYQYGEEYKSRQIANAIVIYRKKRKISTAIQLRSIICSVKKYDTKKINPSTKVFQALRIFINDELNNLEILLSTIPRLLNTKARVVIMTFHSLEDRIVKNNFKQNFTNGIYKLLTKKVVTATQKEKINNPKSRSAKIRAVENNV